MRLLNKKLFLGEQSNDIVLKLPFAFYGTEWENMNDLCMYFNNKIFYKSFTAGPWYKVLNRLLPLLFCYEDEIEAKNSVFKLLENPDDSNVIMAYELIMNRFNEFKTNKDYEKILQNMSNSINNA